jgi:hypothetical protein
MALPVLVALTVGFSLSPPPGAVLTAPTALRRRAPPPVSSAEPPPPGLEETVEKYGLEAGLFSALRTKRAGGAGGGGGDGGDGGERGSLASAGDLLKRYGGAYLLTSTSLALVSFSVCYALVDNGVDVAALIGKVGLEVSSTTSTAGTVGLAYAIHKALSPVRFPPTVALTPIVAKAVFGKTEEGAEDAESGGVQEP